MCMCACARVFVTLNVNNSKSSWNRNFYLFICPLFFLYVCVTEFKEQRLIRAMGNSAVFLFFIFKIYIVLVVLHFFVCTHNVFYETFIYHSCVWIFCVFFPIAWSFGSKIHFSTLKCVEFPSYLSTQWGDIFSQIPYQFVGGIVYKVINHIFATVRVWCVCVCVCDGWATQNFNSNRQVHS